ncbi:MAG: hypothetical protein KDA60_20665 [Planctomycetales bacterium]|nr:hypothetical protein [Planctomycetales bacterium]
MIDKLAGGFVMAMAGTGILGSRSRGVLAQEKSTDDSGKDAANADDAMNRDDSAHDSEESERPKPGKDGATPADAKPKREPPQHPFELFWNM